MGLLLACMTAVHKELLGLDTASLQGPTSASMKEQARSEGRLRAPEDRNLNAPRRRRRRSQVFICS